MLTDNLTTKDVFDYVCDKLYDHMIIHGYKAYSTKSMYLKFDYGVANSLRISDHRGKNHLDYRFNILLNIDHYYREVSSKGYIREYFPKTMIDDCINSIMLNKTVRQKNYRDYNAIVEKTKNSIDRSKGFWRQAKLYERRIT